MATSIIPALIDALVAAARTALPDRLVHDAFGMTSDPGDFLMVGVDDPSGPTPATSADWAQSWAGLGNHARDESGMITCAAYSWNGDGGDAGQKAARDAAFATMAAVETFLRADPTLGVITSGWVQMGASLNLSQGPAEYGVDALLVFQVAFQARI